MPCLAYLWAHGNTRYSSHHIFILLNKLNNISRQTTRRYVDGEDCVHTQTGVIWTQTTVYHVPGHALITNSMRQGHESNCLTLKFKVIR